MTPWLASRKAMEKIPAESGPWVRGVSKTCQVRPRSGEWKTRAARPPVANQMLGSGSSGAEAPSFFPSSRGAEAPLFHGSAGPVLELGAAAVWAKPWSLAALGMTDLFGLAAALGMTE